MKVCSQCSQVVAEEVNTCPACGAEVAAGRTAIDDFRILRVLHESYSSILCKAIRDGQDKPVMIRIFTPNAGVDARLADRLKHELEELQTLPENYFVRHLAIRQSTDGLWYRISEWVDGLNWGTLLSGGRLNDGPTVIQLFGQIAAILDGLHRSGHIIPHLILDDILVYENGEGALTVKIDYKLSRFLDPQLDRPAPMLARLLAMHPDIVNPRPLDTLSDIWSLGKVFVEILCADPDATDLSGRVDALPVQPAIQTLIRLMLSSDPDLRPRSMAAVSAVLAQAGANAVPDAARKMTHDLKPKALIHRINVRMALMAVLLAGVVVASSILWFNLNVLRQEGETALIGYANQYAGSVAFVVVDYWLAIAGQKVYRNRSEGTAFLVDDAGHLLTNRHVVCPWLEDRRLMAFVELLGHGTENLYFDYQIYLWFDGQRAFRRLPALSDSEAFEDKYVTESAFSTRGPRRLKIVGVASLPEKTWVRVHSPLKDDFAVLKIETVPPGLQPLPLSTDFNAERIPKLTPLITLGFPLGSETQAETVNVSVTSGHVRRSFANMFQVDTSLHPGNSGGPFVDQQGRVVGLATIVAVGMARGPIPVATPLSDIGLVLPITKAAAFLKEIKAGKIKWNGEIDVALERRLNRIRELGRQREWQKAIDFASEALDVRRTPSLLMAAGMIHFCAGEHNRGRHLFDQVLSMEPERNMARLMVLVTDWIDGRALSGTVRQSLVALDWRSPDEFLGYLAKILSGEVSVRKAVTGGYTLAEKSWLHLIAGLLEMRRGNTGEAWTFFEKAALDADIDDWSLYLALSQLDRIQRCRPELAADPSMCREYQNRIKRLDDMLVPAIAAKGELHDKLVAIQSSFKSSEDDLEEQRSLLKQLYDIDPSNGYMLIAQAYYAALDEDWDAALDFSRRFLAIPGRTNNGKLSMGLLEPEILNLQGHTDQALEKLEAYRRQITDSWHRAVSGWLLEPDRRAEITAAAGGSPENLLTGHMALGLWAEGEKDIARAISHYKEALSSYADYRIEYYFALGRVKRLRQTEK